MSQPKDLAEMGYFPARADISIPAGAVGSEASSFDVHAFVIRREAGIVLVDSLMQPDHAELIAGALTRTGANFTDIKYIVLTHHHPDHTGGLAEVASRAPQAQILCGAADAGAILASTGISPDTVSTGDAVLGLDVVLTPGHTPGHLCLFDTSSSTVFLGDLVGNRGGLGRAPAQFTENADQAELSLQTVAELAFENGIPSHGDPVLGGASRALYQLATETP